MISLFGIKFREIDRQATRKTHSNYLQGDLITNWLNLHTGHNKQQQQQQQPVREYYDTGQRRFKLLKWKWPNESFLSLPSWLKLISWIPELLLFDQTGPIFPLVTIAFFEWIIYPLLPLLLTKLFPELSDSIRCRPPTCYYTHWWDTLLDVAMIEDQTKT